MKKIPTMSRAILYSIAWNGVANSRPFLSPPSGIGGVVKNFFSWAYSMMLLKEGDAFTVQRLSNVSAELYCMRWYIFLLKVSGLERMGLNGTCEMLSARPDSSNSSSVRTVGIGSSSRLFIGRPSLRSAMKFSVS